VRACVRVGTCVCACDVWTVHKTHGIVCVAFGRVFSTNYSTVNNIFD